MTRMDFFLWFDFIYFVSFLLILSLISISTVPDEWFPFNLYGISVLCGESGSSCSLYTMFLHYLACLPQFNLDSATYFNVDWKSNICYTIPRPVAPKKKKLITL